MIFRRTTSLAPVQSRKPNFTSGLFYGYVVVDLPGLLKNLRGDEDLAGKVLHNLIYLIAEVSPGAKLGLHRSLRQGVPHAS